MKPISYGIAAAAALAAVAGVTASVSAAPDHGDAGSAEAAGKVDMEAVLKAAQIDPRRPDQTVTPGAGEGVLAVERALRSKGLLDEKLVDSHFGTKTVEAYTKFQKSLGLEGLAANGLPGADSLGKLGADRFEVTHVVQPGARTTHDGERVNARTKAMLVEAEKLLGRDLALDQGSYNPGGDPTSAGTHDGGGVVDLTVAGMDEAERTKVVKTLRQVGFAAWDRDPSQGDWPQHIHAAALNDPDLAGAAAHQTGDYHLGKNGLANGAADDGPEVKPIRSWEEYQRAN